MQCRRIQSFSQGHSLSKNAGPHSGQEVGALLPIVSVSSPVLYVCSNNHRGIQFTLLPFHVRKTSGYLLDARLVAAEPSTRSYGNPSTNSRSVTFHAVATKGNTGAQREKRPTYFTFFHNPSYQKQFFSKLPLPKYFPVVYSQQATHTFCFVSTLLLAILTLMDSYLIYLKYIQDVLDSFCRLEWKCVAVMRCTSSCSEMDVWQ